MDPVPEKVPSARRQPFSVRVREQWGGLSANARLRLASCLAFGLLLTLAFSKPLVALVTYVLGNQFHSHVVLIPFVSAYLLRLQYRELPTDYRASPGWALTLLAAGLAALAAAWTLTLSRNDHLALLTLSWLCLLVSGGFFFLGRKWMKAASFPVAFLIFMVPLPDQFVEFLETASQRASTEAASWFFSLAGVPYLREGNVFQLPGMPIQVARECSGIRSSWVLFITGLVAAHMFLKSPWRRAILVGLIIPLGVLRNGFRILVIGWLCVEVDPKLIDSPFHHRGGPIFFALSLIPLFLILWWLRRGETRASARQGPLMEKVELKAGPPAARDPAP